MRNAFSQVTRPTNCMIFAFGLLFSVFSSTLNATVTFKGNNGVSAKIFEVSCNSCHSFDDYATARSNADEIVNRINGVGNLMPRGGPKLSDTLIQLVEAWRDGDDGNAIQTTDNSPESASPSVQSNPANSIGRTDAILNGSVNANGLVTEYLFEWGLDNGGLNFQNQMSPTSTSNTNGGQSPEDVTQPISGLVCETSYQFRLGATNDPSATPIYTNSNTSFFTTADCNFPVINFNGSQTSRVGQTVTIPINLDSDSLTIFDYPINIQYVVSGTADPGDFELMSGTLPINAPDTAASLTFDILGNASAPADATIVIQVTAATNSSGIQNATVPDPSEYTVIIAGNTNVPQPPPLQINQNGLNTQYVYKDKGEVTITANDGAGLFSYDWSTTDTRLSGVASGNSYTFNPSALPGLAAGPYVASVTIDDGSQLTKQTTTVLVGDVSPALACNLPQDDADGNTICDLTEGLGDFDFDGLPDYLDPIGDPALLNKQVSSTGNNATRLITTTSGLSLALNDTAVELVASGAATGAQITANDVIDDPGFSAISAVFDFQIRGLSIMQRTAQVVIPLDKPMPSQSTYRKLANGAWSDFVVTDTDSIRSAKSVQSSNECPPPGDLAYEDGLIAFNDCLELTLTDGGPNDADGEANGVIKDPGAVAIPASTTTTTTSSDANSSPGGAGALGGWLILLLATLLWLPSRFKQGQTND